MKRGEQGERGLPLLSEQSVERLALRFAEAHLLCEEGRYEAALVECRKLGELVAKALLNRSELLRGVSEPQALSLQRAAHLLEKRGALPASASASLIALQPLGNLGAHDQGDDVEPSASSARAACAASAALIEWLWRHEGYALDVLRSPPSLEVGRQARWARHFEEGYGGGAQGAQRATQEVERGHIGERHQQSGSLTLRLTLAISLTLGVAWLFTYSRSADERSTAQETLTTAPTTAPSSSEELTLSLSPARAVFELGERVRVRLVGAAGAEVELGSLTLNGPQFERMGAQLRAVSSGRAQLTACGAHGEGCVRRELMVLLP